MTPQYTLSVAGFLSLLLGFSFCWIKARKSFVTVLWGFLSWLSIGSAAICAYLLGLYISDCLNPSGDGLICNSVQVISELTAKDQTLQVALEFTGVFLFGIGQLAISICLQPKILYGNPLRSKKTEAFYEEIIDQ